MVAEHDGDAQYSADTNPIPDAAKEKPAVATADHATTDSSKTDCPFSRSRGRGGKGNRDNGCGQQGRGRGGDKKGKRKDLSWSEYKREGNKRRSRDDGESASKRQKVNENSESVAIDNGRGPHPDGTSYMHIKFTEEEIAAEQKRPKRKVAVMLGYSGTGYHGMQINHREKTIEGELFAAFVAAGAISKANASDPRKSSFIRCARTDKGVHAAGNVVSLKLIIEDSEVAKRVNDALPPQIRVWGIQRTNGSFSAYQKCDSRWYEYLMPSYCLLPPHPNSFLGKKVLEFVKEKGVEEEYASRLGEVKDFWEAVEKNDIQPIIDGLEPEVREAVLRWKMFGDSNGKTKPKMKSDQTSKDPKAVVGEPETKSEPVDNAKVGDSAEDPMALSTETLVDEPVQAPSDEATIENTETEDIPPKDPVDSAVKQIKAAYVTAMRRYRVTPDRLTQLQEALNKYQGTRNFHNYTIQKSPNDRSAKRHIKSFVVNPNPIQINDTQWLSLKVHGQSFMMHQIRKMVGMAVILTRCATDLSRIEESYGNTLISIPKAPSLGLLLERPVFDTYNVKATESFDRPAIDFKNYEKEMEEFKNAYIYKHIFELEEKENSFHAFFHQIDNFKSDYFLWATAGGIEVAHHRMGKGEEVPEEMKEELGEDDEDVEGDNPEGGEVDSR